MLYLVIVLLVAAGPALAGEEPVVFSEVMWMGSTGSTADEWIELHNRSDESVDLVGWVITRMTDEGERSMLAFESGVLAPRGVFLISNFAPDDPRSRLEATPDLVSSSVALANSKLQLRLYHGEPSSGGILVDIADDGSGAPLAGDPKLKRSMVRIDFQGDGTESAHWATATESQGWDDDTSELGTPGSMPAYLMESAEQARTAIQRESWADLKVSVTR